jgi:hypothetical protein
MSFTAAINWGSFTNAQLPNKAAATVQSGSVRVGDTAYDTTNTAIVFCTTATLGAAVWVAPPPMAIIFLGGASMGAGDTGKHFGAQEGSNGGKSATLTSDNEMTVGFSGAFAILSWNSVAADGTTVFKVIENGLVVQTVTLTGASGVAVLTTTFAAGDQIAVEYDAGTAPGRTNVQVWGRKT